MRSTWDHLDDMGKMIQLRNVPEDLHRKLKARAALAGITLSDYLVAEDVHLARSSRHDAAIVLL